MRCESCEIAYINGVRCHETGCPDAWRDYLCECCYCGEDFVPEYRSQQACAGCEMEYDWDTEFPEEDDEVFDSDF